MVLGTSSTQVWPGLRGIGVPAVVTNCVGEPSVGAVPGARDLDPVAEDLGGAAGVGVEVGLHLEAALAVFEPRPVADLHVLHDHVGRRVLHAIGQYVGRRFRCRNG